MTDTQLETNGKRKENCDRCGQTISPYRVTATHLLVDTMVKFRQAVIDKKENSVSLTKDMNGKPYQLSWSERNNFSRLRFLGLAAKDKNNKAHWLLTKRGSDFLNGKGSIHLWVTVWNNRIIDRSEEMVLVKDVVGTTPYLEQIDNIVYTDPVPLNEPENQISFDQSGQGKLI